MNYDAFSCESDRVLPTEIPCSIQHNNDTQSGLVIPSSREADWLNGMHQSIAIQDSSQDPALNGHINSHRSGILSMRSTGDRLQITKSNILSSHPETSQAILPQVDREHKSQTFDRRFQVSYPLTSQLQYQAPNILSHNLEQKCETRSNLPSMKLVLPQKSSSNQVGECLTQSAAQDMIAAYEPYLRVDPEFALTKYYRLLLSVSEGSLIQENGLWKDAETGIELNVEEFVSHLTESKEASFVNDELENINFDSEITSLAAVEVAWQTGLSEGTFKDADAEFFRNTFKQLARTTQDTSKSEEVAEQSESLSDRIERARLYAASGKLAQAMLLLSQILEEASLPPVQRGEVLKQKACLLSSLDDDEQAARDIVKSAELLQWLPT
eukprot:GHVH01016539.1.p1 GENE.GHVH01016539.1~~GHVH01016539.1.p1  ORF type:complete len:383 (+),score=51.65 GHVH01016539.1:529-1677(+)